ncbi:MAG: cobalamin-dependent protein [Clostridiales bacterium]|nr:cobalamin-dependent protein [Clostridiales bacterium]
MSIIQEIREAIENGRPRETEKLVRQAIGEGISPPEILEEAMTPAMRNAGKAFQDRDGDIPRILTAARSMRKGLDILEPYMDKELKEPIATVVVGAVKGDLHDVGKNLVAIMLRSAGFKVIDLGVDVSEREFLQAVRKNPEVSLVCISSLLTTCAPEMRHVVKTLRENKETAHIRIMVGGGSVTQEMADEMGADAYTETAVDAAEVAKTFFV